VIKPRRSLVRSDVVSQLEAEDLSRTARHQGQDLGQQDYRCRQSTRRNSDLPTMQQDQHVGNSSHGSAMNKETGRLAAFCPTDEEMLNVAESPYWNESATTHLRPSTAESGSSAFSHPAEPSWSGSGSAPHSADDIDDWLSVSLVRPVQKSAVMKDKSVTGKPAVSRSSRVSPVNKTARSVQQRPLYTPFSSQLPLSVTPSLQSGTILDSLGVRNTATASQGSARRVTVFLPTDETSAVRSLPLNVIGSDAERFPSCGRVDSLAGCSSSYMFLRSPDLLPTVRGARGLAMSWPMAARGLTEPSPVATVKPQVQRRVATLDQHSVSSPPHPTETVPEYPAEHTVTAMEALLDPASQRAKRRKRKRRSIYGTRRRRRKTQQTATAVTQSTSTHSPQSVEIPALAGKAQRVTNGLNSQAEVTISSSYDHMGVPSATKPTCIGCTTSKTSYVTQQQQSSASVPKVSTSSRPAVPMTQAAASNTSVSTVRKALRPIENQQWISSQVFASDSCRPSVLQRRGNLGAIEPAGINRGAPTTTSYIQSQPFSGDVEKLPTAGGVSSVQRIVPKASCLGTKSTMVHAKQQKSAADVGLQRVPSTSAVQRDDPFASWLSTKQHNTPMMSYIKQQQQQQQSSADVQKVPTTSPQHDIFEFCEDDDELVSTSARPTPRSFRGTPSQSVQCSGRPAARRTPPMVDPGRQKCVKLGKGRRLR